MLHRAVLRDLDRLTSVLAGPVTAVRRAALIEHVTFLTGELRRHWQLQDELIWPRAVADDPSLAGAADQVRDDHLAAAAQCAAMVTAAEQWARVGDAEHRLLVRDAVREVAAVLPAVFERDGDVTAVALGALTSQDWAAIDRGVVRRRRRRPTALARELFWLLDELDAGERGGAAGRCSAAADVGAAQRVQRRVQPRVVPDVGRRRAGRAGLTARAGFGRVVGVRGCGIAGGVGRGGLSGRGLSRRCPAGPGRTRAGSRTSTTARPVRGPGSASPTVPPPRR